MSRRPPSAGAWLALWAGAIDAWLRSDPPAPALPGRAALPPALDALDVWSRDALAGWTTARVAAVYDAWAARWRRTVADPAHALTGHHAFACAALSVLAEALAAPRDHGVRVPAHRAALGALNTALVAYERDLAAATPSMRAIQQATYLGDQLAQAFRRAFNGPPATAEGSHDE